MFSSTAYEAYYSYIGIYLHQESIKIITSNAFFMALLALILGTSLLFGVWRYLAQYMPGFISFSPTIGMGFFVKTIACFVFGVTLLKIESTERINNFGRRSWHSNKYISNKMNAKESYNVSFIFNVLVRSAEELAKYSTEIIDKLFQKTNSQLDAPNAFYKAVLYAGSQSIDNPKLKENIDIYTESCFDKILPLLGQAKKEDKIKEFFDDKGRIDNDLSLIPITTPEGKEITCLTMKNLVRNGLWNEANRKGKKLNEYSGAIKVQNVDYVSNLQKNMMASSFLLNHYLSKSQDAIGTQKGAKVQGTLANILVGWDRFWSFDGVLNLTGQEKFVGSVLTAKRASQFSEYLQRAPHIKGMVKLFLIALFPWLVFFIVAGRWKVVFSWYAIYFSVLLWTPIWTLLYHLMTSIALSSETMGEFGKISDGISLYSSSFITSKMYQFYAIYSWLQILAGPLPTILLTQGLFGQLLRDSSPEFAPPILSTAKNVALTALTAGKSGLKSMAVKSAANNVSNKMNGSMKKDYGIDVFKKDNLYGYKTATSHEVYPANVKKQSPSSPSSSSPSKEAIKAKFKAVALKNTRRI